LVEGKYYDSVDGATFGARGTRFAQFACMIVVTSGGVEEGVAEWRSGGAAEWRSGGVVEWRRATRSTGMPLHMLDSLPDTWIDNRNRLRYDYDTIIDYDLRICKYQNKIREKITVATEEPDTS